MTGPHPRIAPLGDAAVTITLGDTIGPAVEWRVQAALGALAARFGAEVELVPGYTTVAVHYSPTDWTHATIRDAMMPVLQALPDAGAVRPGPLIEIPVWYDGPDLEDVARLTGLTVSDVIARHAGAEYRVALLGFVPGFAYLGGLDPALALPRRSTPRPRVPAGSVAIGGGQTGVYPAATPGGWHLIGRTEVPMFDPTRSPPALLAVGDRVRFVEQR